MENLISAPVQKPRHIPSLDGLRALSILLVMTLHTLQRFSLTHHVPLVFFVLGNGGLGVQIFFVISGYLITTLLLRENEKKRRISLSAFYIRRAFRILPPLYVYICCIAILGYFGRVALVNAHSLLMAFTLTQNYIHLSSPWAFEQFWSLCIEEQFYLLWPGILAFCLMRYRGDRGKLAAARVALVVACIEPVVRVLYFHFTVQPRHYAMFHLMADGLMFGCLGALLQGHHRFEVVYRSVTRWPWLLMVLLFVVISGLGVRYENYFQLPLGLTLESFAILMWMLWLVRNPDTWLGQVMNQPVIAWVGRLSYSLYLWQTFFLHYESVKVFGGNTIFNTFPGNWFSALAVAAFSYYVIEQPALRLRDRVMARRHWREI